jgi:hypothetical protein
MIPSGCRAGTPVAVPCRRIDDRDRSPRSAAVAHIDALRCCVVAHVVGVGIGTEVQGLEEGVVFSIVEAQLPQLARYRDAVYTWHMDGRLRMLQAGDAIHRFQESTISTVLLPSAETIRMPRLLSHP